MRPAFNPSARSCAWALAALFGLAWHAKSDAPSAFAGEDLLFKCRNSDGGVLYSNEPCEKQNARQIKVLPVERAPAPQHAAPPALAPGAAAVHPGAAAGGDRPDPNDPDDVRPKPVMPYRAPSLEAIENSAAATESWWTRTRAAVLGWFGH